MAERANYLPQFYERQTFQQFLSLVRTSSTPVLWHCPTSFASIRFFVFDLLHSVLAEVIYAIYRSDYTFLKYDHPGISFLSLLQQDTSKNFPGKQPDASEYPPDFMEHSFSRFLLVTLLITAVCYSSEYYLNL